MNNREIKRVVNLYVGQHGVVKAAQDIGIQYATLKHFLEGEGDSRGHVLKQLEAFASKHKNIKAKEPASKKIGPRGPRKAKKAAAKKTVKAKTKSVKRSKPKAKAVKAAPKKAPKKPAAKKPSKPKASKPEAPKPEAASETPAEKAAE